MAVQLPCACGHDREAHEHYRAGSDCSRCDCLRYRRSGPGLRASVAAAVAQAVRRR